MSADTVKIAFNYLGGKAHAELNMPTNKEHNEFAAKRLRVTGDEELMALRAAEFDRLCVSSTPPKVEIFDAAKSAVFFQLFENFAIDQKN